MSSMVSLDRLQAELSGNVFGDAYDRLYNLTVDVSIEHAELMALATKWIRKERLEPLEAENAKLREVVEAILQCAGETKRDKGCEACPMYNSVEGYTTDGIWCYLFPTLRELGLEMDHAG